MEESTQQILALTFVAAVIVIALLKRRRKRHRSATSKKQAGNTETPETPIHFIRTRKRSKK
jgi:hypothetical protein